MKTILLLTVLLLSPTLSRAAGFFDALGLTKKSTNDTATLTSSLSQDQVIDGLKQALQNGIQQAIQQLGHDGGFLTNLNVKIPMPDQLRTVEKTLRKLKQDRYADQF